MSPSQALAALAQRSMQLQVTVQPMLSPWAEPWPWGWSGYGWPYRRPGPGLIGGVMVGLVTAKALAMAADKPLIAVNHLEGHALSARLAEPALAFPYLLLLASGGHCQILEVRGLGQYRRLATTARSFGMEMHLISPEEVRRMWPLMDVSDLVGGEFAAIPFLLDERGEGGLLLTLVVQDFLCHK